MPYKIPNTFKAQTPLGQSVQNLMESYFGNMPTPEDKAKAEYMRSGAEAANANAALNRMKLDAYNSGQGVYEKMVNNQEGLSPEESFRQNYAAYQSYLDKIGQTGSSGKVALAMSPWVKGSTDDTINRAQLGSGMATNSTLAGTLQHEGFENQREGIRQAGQDRRLDSKPAGKNGKGVLPYQAVKMQNDLISEISAANNTVKDAQPFLDAIDNGTLSFGPMDNAEAYLRSKTNSSTPLTQNKALFDSWLEEMRNNRLLLNKGTQTEGDAVRALAGLISTTTDTQTVKRHIKQIQNIFSRVAEQRKQNLGNVTTNYGQPSVDLSGYDQGSAIDLPTGKRNTFDEMPDPAQYNGRKIQDPDTGEVFISNGVKWIPQ